MFHLRCSPLCITMGMCLLFQMSSPPIPCFYVSKKKDLVLQNSGIFSKMRGFWISCLFPLTILGIFKWGRKRQKNQVICGKFPTFSNPKKDPWLRTKRWVIQQACGTGCFGSWKDKMLLGKQSRITFLFELSTFLLTCTFL